MQQIALAVFLAYIVWLFARDTKRRPDVSQAIWIVVIWVVITGSRPVSTWFNFGGQTGGAAAAYDEGNPFERFIFLILIGLGVAVCSRRNVRFGDVMKANKWLTIFFVYWALSVLWADAPFVALKRWVKDVGNLVMVCVVFSEKDPMGALKAVFVRSASLLVPMSILLIKFYSELGRAYHVWTGEMMYTGVTTHKNSLGSSVLVAGLFVLWDFVERHKGWRTARNRVELIGDASLLVLMLWLLIKAHSATALGCAALGAGIYLALGLRTIQTKVKHLEAYTIGLILVVGTLNSVFDVANFVVVNVLGRDMTLTTRTEVWPMLLSQSESVFLGAGFNSFWSGQRLELIYSQLGIIQAHNGYLETYLNGGICAVVLLTVLLFTSARNIKQQIVAGNHYARVRFAVLIIAVIYDCTEAAFNKMGPMWFALLLVMTQFPRRRTSPATVKSSAVPRGAGMPEDAIPPAAGAAALGRQ